MANNKIQLGDGTVLLDLTGDTVSASTLKQGITAHNSAGVQITGTMQEGGTPPLQVTADASVDFSSRTMPASISNVSATASDIDTAISNGRDVELILNGHTPNYEDKYEVIVPQMTQGADGKFRGSISEGQTGSLSSTFNGNCYLYIDSTYVKMDYDSGSNSYSWNYDWENDTYVDSESPVYVGLTFDIANSLIEVWSNANLYALGINFQLYADTGYDFQQVLSFRQKLSYQGGLGYLLTFVGSAVEPESGASIDIFVSVLKVGQLQDSWGVWLARANSPLTLFGDLNVSTFAVTNMSQSYSQAYAFASNNFDVDIRLFYTSPVNYNLEAVVARLVLVGESYMSFSTILYANLGQGYKPYLFSGVWNSSDSAPTVTPIELATASQIPAASMNSQTGVLSID